MHNRFAAIAAFAALASSTAASAIGAGSASPSTPVLAAQDSGTPRKGFLGGVFGCSADGSKQEIGAAAGGALGAILGNRIAGRGSRTLGTLIGGALGAAAGSAVGCKLQKTDQQKAERALEDAVASGRDQSWKSDETGASGTVEVGQATGVALSDIRFANGVEPAAGYSKVGATYAATANANLRASPTTSGKLLGQLATGQRVWVPASVTGQPWLLVSQDGVAKGYVSSPLLKKAATQTASGCKMVKQTIDVPGSGPESESYQACKGSDGNWVMTRV